MLLCDSNKFTPEEMATRKKELAVKKVRSKNKKQEPLSSESDSDEGPSFNPAHFQAAMMGLMDQEDEDPALAAAIAASLEDTNEE